MNRRDMLKLGLGGGAVFGGVALTADYLDGSRRNPDGNETLPSGDGSTPTPDPPGIRHADDFGTVVDVVAAGADSNGEEPINDIIEAEAADDTLLTFRPGTYLLEPTRLSGYQHLGVAGALEKRPTFVSAPGECRSDPYLHFEGVDDFLLDGVNFDFSGEETGGELRIIADGDATVRRVRAAGSCSEQIALFRIDIVDADGTGIVENFQAQNIDADRSLTGVYVGEPHAGELTFRNCELEGFSDNGLYASSPGHEGGENGPVYVEGGIYKNNNVSNVRLGSTDSTATGVRIVAEEVPSTDSVNVRGIRLREGGGQLIQNCDIQFGSNAGDGFGAIVFHAANTGAIVRDTKVTMDRDTVPAIRTFPNDRSSSGLVFENLSVDGNASRGFAALLEGRPGTVFRNCDIRQTGSERGGLRLAFCPDCEIIDSRIDVTANPLVLRQSSALVRNTTIVTPDGEQYIEEMDAEDEDFTPR